MATNHTRNHKAHLLLCFPLPAFVSFFFVINPPVLFLSLTIVVMSCRFCLLEELKYKIKYCPAKAQQDLSLKCLYNKTKQNELLGFV